MKSTTGNLITLANDGQFDVIIHGCNCLNNMGAGIAKSIKQEYPEAYKADLTTRKGDKKKLGTYSSATVIRAYQELVIVNAYTQYEYSRQKVCVDYRAVESVFGKIREDFHGKRIGYPLIGAGLAGGDWERISAIIDEALEGEDHTLVRFK